MEERKTENRFLTEENIFENLDIESLQQSDNVSMHSNSKRFLTTKDVKDESKNQS